MAPGVRKYSKTLHEVIVQGVRNGNPKEIAFRATGLHPDTIFEWLTKGRAQPDRYPEYVRLAEDIEQAQAEYAEEALALIQAAARSDPKHWTAQAWILERTRPEHFARRDKVEVEAGSKPLVQLNQVVLVDGEARHLARELLRRVAAPLPRANDSAHDDADVIDVPAEEVDEDT
jgi:hypothetical protein